MKDSPELVIPRIFAALDDHRFADLPTFYTQDVQAQTAVGHIVGRDPLVSTLTVIHQPVPYLQHLVTGVIVDGDDEEASARANIVALFCDDQHQPTLTGGSVWRGRLRRGSDGWRVFEFSLDVVWTRGAIPTDWGVSGA